MGPNRHVIAGLEMNWLRVSVKQQPCFALEHDDPFGFVLIVPEVFRACVSGGHDAFDADVIVLDDGLSEFYWKLGRKRRKEVRRLSLAFLAKRHIDDL
jgi:hypothetical protein